MLIQTYNLHSSLLHIKVLAVAMLMYDLRAYVKERNTKGGKSCTTYEQFGPDQTET